MKNYILLQYDNRNVNGDLKLFREKNEFYCKLYNYEYIFKTERYDNYSPWWIKVYLANYYIQNTNCAGVLWLDTDACIHDLSYKIEDLIKEDINKDFYIATDNYRRYKKGGEEIYNTGVWLVKNTLNGKNIMKKWLNLYNPQLWKNENNIYKCISDLHNANTIAYEQGAFNIIIKKEFKDCICFLNWQRLQGAYKDVLYYLSGKQEERLYTIHPCKIWEDFKLYSENFIKIQLSAFSSKIPKIKNDVFELIYKNIDNFNISKNKKELILGAYTYNDKTIFRNEGGLGMFVKTLRKYNKECVIIILMNKITDKFKKFCKLYDVNYILGFDQIGAAIQRLRYIVFYNLVLKYSHFEKILIADVNDAIFQDDPFKINCDEHLYYSQEINHFEGVNRNWLENIENDIKAIGGNTDDELFSINWDLFPTHNEMMNNKNKVVCCGTIIGKYSDILEYLSWYNDMHYYYKKKPLSRDTPGSFSYHNDQALYNLFIYQIKKHTPIELSKSKIMTIDKVKISNYMKNGTVVNDNSQKYIILHQINRMSRKLFHTIIANILDSIDANILVESDKNLNNSICSILDKNRYLYDIRLLTKLVYIPGIYDNIISYIEDLGFENGYEWGVFDKIIEDNPLSKTVNGAKLRDCIIENNELLVNNKIFKTFNITGPYNHSHKKYFSNKIPIQYLKENPYINNVESIIKFSIVQNPYDRIINLYEKFKNNTFCSDKCNTCLNKWICQMLSSKYKNTYIELFNQSIYLLDKQNKLIVDKIIKYENFNENFKNTFSFDKNLNKCLDSIELDKSLYTKDDLYKESIELINSFYYNDFTLLKYEMIKSDFSIDDDACSTQYYYEQIRSNFKKYSNLIDNTKEIEWDYNY